MSFRSFDWESRLCPSVRWAERASIGASGAGDSLNFSSQADQLDADTPLEPHANRQKKRSGACCESLRCAGDDVDSAAVAVEFDVAINEGEDCVIPAEADVATW